MRALRHQVSEHAGATAATPSRRLVTRAPKARRLARVQSRAPRSGPIRARNHPLRDSIALIRVLAHQTRGVQSGVTRDPTRPLHARSGAIRDPTRPNPGPNGIRARNLRALGLVGLTHQGQGRSLPSRGRSGATRARNRRVRNARIPVRNRHIRAPTPHIHALDLRIQGNQRRHPLLRPVRLLHPLLPPRRRPEVFRPASHESASPRGLPCLLRIRACQPVFSEH